MRLLPDGGDEDGGLPQLPQSSPIKMPRARTASPNLCGRNSTHIDKPGRRKRLREHIRARQRAREAGQPFESDRSPSPSPSRAATADPQQSLAATQQRLEQQIEQTEYLERQMRSLVGEVASLRSRVVAAEAKVEALESRADAPPPRQGTWGRSGGAISPRWRPAAVTESSARPTWTQRLVGSPRAYFPSPRRAPPEDA